MIYAAVNVIQTLYTAGGIILFLGTLAAAYVVVRGASSTKLMELRKSIEDAQDEKIKILQDQLIEAKAEHQECLTKHDALATKYATLQEQVTGTDAIVHLSQIILARHTESQKEHKALLASINMMRKQLGTRGGDGGPNRHNTGKRTAEG